MRVVSFSPSSSSPVKSLLSSPFRPSRSLTLFARFLAKRSLGTSLILYSQSIHFRGSPLEFLSFPALRSHQRSCFCFAGIHSSHAIPDKVQQFSLLFVLFFIHVYFYVCFTHAGRIFLCWVSSKIRMVFMWHAMRNLLNV